VQFSEVKEAHVWHETVQLFNVIDTKTKSFVGLFYTYIHTHIYIYIYAHTYTHTHTHTHIHIHTHIHTYVHTYDTRTKSFVGQFYLDLFPRAGKFTHAACFPLLPSCRAIGSQKRQTPIAAMVANFKYV